MQFIKKVSKFKGLESDILDEIYQILDYENGSDELYIINLENDLKWKIHLDELIIYYEDNIEYKYTIASYCGEGEKLYIGVKDDIVIVIAHLNVLNYHDDEIFILSKKLKID